MTTKRTTLTGVVQTSFAVRGLPSPRPNSGLCARFPESRFLLGAGQGERGALETELDKYNLCSLSTGQGS